MGGFAVQSFRREIVRVCDFSGLKDIFQVFAQFVILSRSEEMEEAFWQKDEGFHSRGWSHQQRDKDDFPDIQRENALMKIRNRIGPRTLPWGTPALTIRGEETFTLRATRRLRE